ncbi:hypothetical protein [Pseudovibrio sp. Ad37]|uniref:hypothetical protein n=1 Tax=Pseudovibrio sp. Ad37 TaxID=989422 RepID=UPI0012906515|nr:hypothetical protein [Pseudovibrio sp. Ad37]
MNERLQAKIEEDRKALDNHRAELEKTGKAQMGKLAAALQLHAQNSASACEDALKTTSNAIEQMKVETIQSADKSLSAHLTALEDQLGRYSEVSQHQLKRASVWTIWALTVSVLIVLSGFGLGWIVFNWDKSELESMRAEKTALDVRIKKLKSEQKDQIAANTREQEALSGIGLDVIKDPSGTFLSRQDGRDLNVQSGFSITNPETGQKQQVVKIGN